MNFIANRSLYLYYWAILSNHSCFQHNSRAVARGVKLGGCKLSVCRLVGMALERCFFVTHTYSFVEGLKFLSICGVARYLPLEGVNCE